MADRRAVRQQDLFAVVLSVAKDLAPATRPLFDHSVRSFASLRMTGMSAADIDTFRLSEA
jgi:hypothetical protein